VSEYVQYGCGWSSAEGWRNFDASPTLRFERMPIVGKLYTKNATRFPPNVEYGDIVAGLPVAGNSFRGVYCSHILEHLSLDDFRKAIINTYGILENGGYFRLVLPDLEYAINKYSNDLSADAAFVFLRETSLGKETRSHGLKGLLQAWFGNSQHLWMWDYKSIAQELESVGFTNIRRAEYGDASDVAFTEVENVRRWRNCLGVECKKPTAFIGNNESDFLSS